jgi:type II secretory ATPase GspE/PulE/Tfp pilus assembly ATPase PilB-like protein
MSKQLEIVLRHSGLMTPDQVQRSADQARRRNMPLSDLILKDNLVSEDALADALAKYLRLPRVRLANSESDPEALKKVPEKTVRKHHCLPLSLEGKTMTVAMADPTDYLAIQDVEFAAGLSVRPVVATRTELQDGVEERYAAENRIGSFLANVPEVAELQIVPDEMQDLAVDAGDARSQAEVAPVVKMVNLVVFDAIKSGASDLHIEPTLHDVHVRMRVDGVLRDYTHVPKWLHGPLISRLKVLAKLDITERRLPQDGRVNVQYQGRTIDLRVSTLPTHFGEKAVLRVLGGGATPQVDKMGLNAQQAAALDLSIAQPQGMILVTGPTGSGKTTTLYAVIAKRRSPEVNIVTVEDPIEYQLTGINQVQVNTKAGLSFAGVLRSILRQDPDVILVGEMRDEETAEVAFQAAMTGHLVLSTLHTNSAVGAIPRLFDLNVDPNILSTSLTLVIAQRLVRRICEQCKETYRPDPATAQRVGLGPTEGPVYRGRGCPACGGTGFQGRLGIFEFFKPTVNLRRMIHDRVGEVELRNAARKAGMKLLREDALDKIRQGLTSPDEVLRVVQVDETEVPCPNCHAPIEPEFSVCPYCLFAIRKTCASCGQNMKPDWKACPYCNAVAQVQSLAEPTGREPAAAEEAAPAPLPRRGRQPRHTGESALLESREEKQRRARAETEARVEPAEKPPARRDRGPGGARGEASGAPRGAGRRRRVAVQPARHRLRKGARAEGGRRRPRGVGRQAPPRRSAAGRGASERSARRPGRRRDRGAAGTGSAGARRHGAGGGAVQGRRPAARRSAAAAAHATRDGRRRRRRHPPGRVVHAEETTAADGDRHGGRRPGGRPESDRDAAGLRRPRRDDAAHGRLRNVPAPAPERPDGVRAGSHAHGERR